MKENGLTIFYFHICLSHQSRLQLHIIEEIIILIMEFWCQHTLGSWDGARREVRHGRDYATFVQIDIYFYLFGHFQLFAIHTVEWVLSWSEMTSIKSINNINCRNKNRKQNCCTTHPIKHCNFNMRTSNYGRIIVL